MQPEGLIDAMHPDWVCRLNKSLYGLKQASHEWYQAIDQHLQKNGFKPTPADPCLYYSYYKDKIVFIALYVDDCIIMAPRGCSKPIKELIAKAFPFKDLGPATSVLGIEMLRNRDKGKLYLRQKGKIEEALVKFNMANCKPVNTPIITGLTLVKIDRTDPKVQAYPYRTAIGTLNYIAQCSRPDILYAVNHLSRYCNAYDSTHVQAVKRIFRYLQGTKDYAICYDKSNVNISEPQVPTGYSDADWGNLIPERRSISGNVFTYCNALISWSSHAQGCVALSSTEAELNALSEAARQALYVRKHFNHLGIQNEPIVPIYCDNQSALTIVKSSSGSYHGRLKHYDIKIQHLRDESAKQNINVLYCPTEDMPADMLTKPLPRAKLERLCTILHLGLPDVK